MKTSSLALVFAVVNAGTFGIPEAVGQNFPTRPIRIVTSGPGGNTDFASRLIAEGINGPLGQPVIVENRASVLGAEIVAKALPNGHTLIYAGGILWLGALLGQTPYAAPKDFAPVAWVTSTPNLLVVTPSLAANNAKELIALAKSKPGALSYAATAAGTSPFLAGELFKAMAGVDIVRVLYKGTPAALPDLAAGQVQLAFPVQEGVAAFVKSGKLRALAVTSAKASPLAPGLPTIAESGLPGYEFSSMFGMFAPASTPRPIIDRLNSEIVHVVRRPDIRDKFLNSGAEPVGGSPEQLLAAIKTDVAKWSKLVRENNIKGD